ncbi:hypothetical protein [Streptomyces sp. NBC_01718]
MRAAAGPVSVDEVPGSVQVVDVGFSVTSGTSTKSDCVAQAVVRFHA